MNPSRQKAVDPLKFWPEHGQKIPIFMRLARNILPSSPTSCNCEEFFSVTGRICSPLRSRLSPDMLEALSCLYYWKRDELKIIDPRQKTRRATCERFAVLSFNLTPVQQDVDDGENVDEDDDIQENFTEDLVAEGVESMDVTALRDKEMINIHERRMQGCSLGL